MSASNQNTNILHLKKITKIYPGTVALHNVDIEVKTGEVHGVIGKNGAGKSTLVGIISGMIAPSSGEIYLRGRRLAYMSRIDAKKNRIAIVTQEPQIIADFTVAENLFLGDYPSHAGVVDWTSMVQKATDIFAQAKLHLDVRAKASDLSLSEQQMVLVLKACYVEKADMIILDEASASLSQADEKAFYDIIAERKKAGKTIIIISHRTDELLAVCDRVTVIRDGHSILTTGCAELNREKLSALIVGDGFQHYACDGGQTQEQKSAPVVLKITGLTRVGSYKDISLELKQGEILGLAGIRGSGRTELLKSLVGIEPQDRGTVAIDGQKVKITSPSVALSQGMVYMPEDREKEGLIAGLSVRENLVLNSLSQISRGGIMVRNKEAQLVAKLIKKHGIVTATAEQEVNQLSGGNKQKVVISKISAFKPRVYLLDEPTRGIDIAAKDSILKAIREDLSQESGIIMTSPGLDDLLMVCDRILVLYQGHRVAEYIRDQFNERDIFLAMQGNIELEKKPAEAVHKES